MTSDLTARLDLCEVDVYVCTGKTFGENCRLVCHCKNSGCDNVNGQCTSAGCDVGYQGNSCSQLCDITSFGEDCTSDCHCNIPGCSSIIGVCATPGCAAGYQGNTCSTVCTGKTFGENCRLVCHCKNSGCDHVNGQCTSAGCDAGYQGNSCSQLCNIASFGEDCTSDCNCNIPGCSSSIGVCATPGCAAGYQGNTCSTACGSGEFGKDCLERCYCKQDGCSTTDGLCLNPQRGCQDGWIGTSCNKECDTKYFGGGCVSECNCKADTCHHITGKCASPGCEKGWMGESCSQECGVRTFDEDCASTCHCASAGCDRFQGTCDDPDAGCTDGYTGGSCSQASASLSDICGTGTHHAVCDDPTTTSCIKGTTPGTMVCRCNHGLFDSNGYSTAGGICTPMSNLEVTEVKSSGAVGSSSVTITWTPPSDSSQISSYSVVWRVSGSADVTGSFYAGKLESATITGLTPGTSYVFTVKSTETGSRASPQEVESNSNVIITFDTSTCTSNTPWIAAISSSALLIVLLAISNAFLWNRSRESTGTCKHKEESNYETPERVYTNTDMHLYTLTHEDSQQAARTGTGDEGYSNIDVYDTAS